MIVGMIFIIVAWVFVAIAEICKSNGFYRGTVVFRVLTLLYIESFVVYGFADPTRFQVVFGVPPIKGLLAFGVAYVYSSLMFILELYLPRKYYPNYLDVPRQVLYKVGKYGKCIVLSEKEAKKAHANGETVYIHAMARVTYKPKDESEKEKPKGVDTGKGLDSAGYAMHDQQRKTFEAMMANPADRDKITELLNRLKEVNEKREGL